MSTTLLVKVCITMMSTRIHKVSQQHVNIKIYNFIYYELVSKFFSFNLTYICIYRKLRYLKPLSEAKLEIFYGQPSSWWGGISLSLHFPIFYEKIDTKNWICGHRDLSYVCLIFHFLVSFYSKMDYISWSWVSYQKFWWSILLINSVLFETFEFYSCFSLFLIWTTWQYQNI